MRNLLAGVAAIAVIASPVLAQNGNGNENSNAKSKAENIKPGRSNGGNEGKNDRGSRDLRNERDARDNDRRDARDNDRRDARDNDRREARDNDRRDARDSDRYGIFSTAQRGLIEGCPPGLAAKRNGCLPPGQAKKQNYDPRYFSVRSVQDGRFFYDNGYLLRLGSGGGISGYIPLLGGALSVGNQWPDYYRSEQLPDYYSQFYGLGQPDSYRYADDVLYRLDPETAAITSIAALLTGDQFTVGQPIPRGYDAYNVPFNYRDQYRDSPDRNFRYSDGYVYQVDPETRLVAAVIELLV
jgi:hypothetical protein